MKDGQSAESFDGVIARLQDGGAYEVNAHLHVVCDGEDLKFSACCRRCFEWAEVDQRGARELYDNGPAGCQRCKEDVYLIANAGLILKALEIVVLAERRLQVALDLKGPENIPYLFPEGRVEVWTASAADRLLREDFELTRAQGGSGPAIFKLPVVPVPWRYIDKKGTSGLRRLSFGSAIREVREMHSRLLAAKGRERHIAQRPEL